MGILIILSWCSPLYTPLSPKKIWSRLDTPSPRHCPDMNCIHYYTFMLQILQNTVSWIAFYFPKCQKVNLDGTAHDIMIIEKNSTLRWCNGPGFCLSTVKFCSKSNFPWTKFNPSPFIQRESLARVSYICGGKSMHTFRCDVKMDVLRSTDVAW